MQTKTSVGFGDEKALSAHLQLMAGRFENEADSLWQRVDLDAGARVWPGILRCLARQLQIIDLAQKMPIEVLAGACRTIFELNIRTRQMVSQPGLIREFLNERAFDEMDLLEGMKKLTTKQELRETFDARLSQLRVAVQKHHVKRPLEQAVWQRAKAANMANEYSALYRFYSKYTHATPWLSITQPEERDGSGYRQVLLLQSQAYAEDAFAKITAFVAKATKGPQVVPEKSANR
jgi:hypothetical protein